jgi:hypothetical protein
MTSRYTAEYLHRGMWKRGVSPGSLEEAQKEAECLKKKFNYKEDEIRITEIPEDKND